MSKTLGKTLESGIYHGSVFHQRNLPKLHKFTYKIYLFWLKLDEIENIHNQVKGFSCHKKGWSVVKYTRKDYLGDVKLPLETAVLNRMNELTEQTLAGEVFLLGQVRTFGLYFSPANFYFLKNAEGVFTHMLAEVSNTPWNQRHHYLVDLSKQENSEKVFHVSPFNPMDMLYKWKIQQPSEQLSLQLSCYKKQKHFEAAINMQRRPLTSASLRHAIIAIPSMTIKTVAGIYWQAIKLFFKRIPIYTHS